MPGPNVLVCQSSAQKFLVWNKSYCSILPSLHPVALQIWNDFNKDSELVFTMWQHVLLHSVYSMLSKHAVIQTTCTKNIVDVHLLSHLCVTETWFLKSSSDFLMQIERHFLGLDFLVQTTPVMIYPKAYILHDVNAFHC